MRIPYQFYSKQFNSGRNKQDLDVPWTARCNSCQLRYGPYVQNEQKNMIYISSLVLIEWLATAENLYRVLYLSHMYAPHRSM